MVILKMFIELCDPEDVDVNLVDRVTYVGPFPSKLEAVKHLTENGYDVPMDHLAEIDKSTNRHGQWCAYRVREEYPDSEHYGAVHECAMIVDLQEPSVTNPWQDQDKVFGVSYTP